MFPTLFFPCLFFLTFHFSSVVFSFFLSLSFRFSSFLSFPFLFFTFLFFCFFPTYSLFFAFLFCIYLKLNSLPVTSTFRKPVLSQEPARRKVLNFLLELIIILQLSPVLQFLVLSKTSSNVLQFACSMLDFSAKLLLYDFCILLHLVKPTQ